MSSAVLYLAIIAIWACVLIPRWLKRDPAHNAAAPAPAPHAAQDDEAEAGDEEAGDEEEPGERPVRVAAPLSPEESRRRMLAARRRLMVMLIGLEIAAVTLAVLKLAAVWVVVPPTVMLAGYLMLLREAGRADAEFAQQEAEAAAAARARERARARAAQSRRPVLTEGASAHGTSTADSGGAAALAARFAAAPVAEDYEGTGRDFAPGLAGKYTTSNSRAQPADDDFGETCDESYEAADYDRADYDRAVGD
jgi:hypothetical protein